MHTVKRLHLGNYERADGKIFRGAGYAVMTPDGKVAVEDDVYGGVRQRMVYVFERKYIAQGYADECNKAPAGYRFFIDHPISETGAEPHTAPER